MNYKICKATIDDLDKLYNIQNSETHMLISYNNLKLDLNEENKIYFISKSNTNDIIGFIGISLLVDHVDIECIIVKKNYRNLKVGSSLLNYAIDYCKKHDLNSIFLEVRASNIPAIKLYENFNFKNISIRKNYYSDNFEDALVYLLKI